MPRSHALASLERAPDRTVRVVELAARQEGVVARWQLRQAGVGDGAIGRWVRSGRLIRVHPGVYALGHHAVGTRGRLIAALLYAGDGSALSHTTGARLWRVAEAPWTPIHVVTEADRKSLPGLVVHRPRRVFRVVLEGLPVTPLVDTLLAFAGSADERSVRKALAEADYRWRVDPWRVRRALGRGRPGSATLRRALDHHLPELARTASPAEDELLLACERNGVPIPEPNARVGDYRVDALWREARVAVEVDGRSAHSSAARRLVDHDRDMYLRSVGLTVLRYSGRQLREIPDEITHEILAALTKQNAN